MEKLLGGLGSLNPLSLIRNNPILGGALAQPTSQEILGDRYPQTDTLNLGGYMQEQFLDQQPLLEDVNVQPSIDENDLIVQPNEEGMLELQGYPEGSNYVEMSDEQLEYELLQLQQQQQIQEGQRQEEVKLPDERQQNEMIRLARQSLNVIPIEYRVRAQQFLYDSWQNPQEFRKRCIDLIKGARNILLLIEFLYYVFKPKMTKDPQRDQMTDQKFMEFTQDKPLPEQCQRFYYREDGILKSRVMCKFPSKYDDVRIYYNM